MMATTNLPPEARTKLAKLCGMLGSDQLGERAAAALKADEFVRSHGLSWMTVIAGVEAPVTRPRPAASCRNWHAELDFCRRHVRELPGRDAEFIMSVSARRSGLSDKQTAWVNSIADRLRRDGHQ